MHCNFLPACLIGRQQKVIHSYWMVAAHSRSVSQEVCPRGLCLVPCCLYCISMINWWCWSWECNENVCQWFKSIARNIQNPCDTDILQQDLNYTSNWSKIRLLNFNATKCSLMHMGRNDKATYKLFNLATNSIPTYHGIKKTTSHKLQCIHCHKIANKANQA